MAKKATAESDKVVDVKSTDLVPIKRVDVDEVNAIIATRDSLVAKYSEVKFDCSTKDGDKVARAARKELVSARTNIDKARLEARRQVNEMAEEFTATIAPFELAADTAIKAQEAIEQAAKEKEEAEERERNRLAEEARVAKEAKEKERVDTLNARIAKLKDFPLTLIGKPAIEIEEMIGRIKTVAINPETFSELWSEAETIRADVLTKLGVMLASTKKAEADAEELRVMREQMAATNAAASKVDTSAQDAEAARLRKEESDRVEARKTEARGSPVRGAPIMTKTVEQLDQQANDFIRNADQSSTQRPAVNVQHDDEPPADAVMTPAGNPDDEPDQRAPSTNRAAMFTAVDVVDLVCAKYGIEVGDAFQQLCFIDFHVAAKNMGYGK